MRALRFFIVAALATSTTAAFADAKSQAKEHLERASIAHKEGRYEDALKDLEIAYTLDPQPALLYGIGQVQVMTGHCPQAIQFYERYLASKPSAAAAAKATEAIETCKKLIADPDNPKAQDPNKPLEPPHPPPVERTFKTTPWYSDTLGDVLTSAGIGFGLGSIVVVAMARGDRDEAEAAVGYDNYNTLVERAKTRQTISIVCGVGGIAFVGAGVIRYLTRNATVEVRRVAVVPTKQGGLVTWSARF